MNVRLAQFEDFQKIAQLHARSWQLNYQHLMSPEYLDKQVANDLTALWQTRLTNPPFNQYVIVAEEGGLICGFVCAFGNHSFEYGTFIDNLHIDDAYMNRGFAKQLMRAVKEWASTYYANSGVYLEVLTKNEHAVNFYERISGEKLIEREWQSPCGRQLDETLYRWKTANDLKV
jgi:ribosomal protein S18 acetylase RimI-like enzyme